jgi:hypothetical protein
MDAILAFFLGGLAFALMTLRESLVNSFKCGYYEQKLKNARDKFTDDEWALIEKTMNKKSITDVLFRK